MAGKKYYRAREVAELLGVSVSSVWSWTAQGKLKATRIGDRARRWAIEDIEAFVKTREKKDDGSNQE